MMRAKMNGRAPGRAALLCAAVLCSVAGAQTTTMLQIPTVSAAAGIPASATQSVCATAIALVSGTNTGDGCPATQALLKTSTTSVLDSYGNIYIADNGNKQLRVLYRGGSALAAAIVASYNSSSKLTLAQVTPGYIYNLVGGGSTTGTTATGAVGSATSVAGAMGIALDSDGNVFFGDNATRLRIFYVAGTKVQTLLTNAGQAVGTLKPGYEYALITGSSGGYAGDGLAASNSTVKTNGQRGLAVDAKENVYIADSSNNAIRKITASTGLISTYIGSAGCVQGTAGSCTAGDVGNGGPIGSAEVDHPWSLIFDANGNLYFSEEGSGEIRAVYNGSGSLPGVTSPQNGYIYQIAGGGSSTTSGVSATSAKFTGTTYATLGLGFDKAGNLYVADRSGRVWEVDAATQIATILVGSGSATTVGGLCLSTNTAGPTATDTVGDGCLGTQAVFGLGGENIEFDPQGNLYIVDSTNNLLRELSRTTIFSSTATGAASGVQTLGFSSLAAQTLGSVKFGVEGATTADFTDAGSSTCTSGTALSAGSTCLVNLQMTPTLPGYRSGFVGFTNAGGTVIGSFYAGGTATGSALAVDTGSTSTVGVSPLKPQGVAADAAANIYVADASSASLIKYSAGVASALATGLSATAAQIAVDGEGNVAVADAGNNRILLYNKQAQTTGAIASYAANSTGSSVIALNAPQGVVADNAGNLYVSDTGNSAVVEFYAQGGSRTLTTSVTNPTRLALDGSGNLYIVDAGGGRVVEIPSGTGTQTTVSTTGYTPAAVQVDAAGNLYVLDSSSNQIAVIPPSASGATNYNLVTGLLTPKDFAVDEQGNLYVADSSEDFITVVNRQSKSIAFGLVNVGTSATEQDFTLTNLGNSQLSFTNNGIAAVTGDAADFTVTTAGANGCTAPLAAGARCAMASVFTPAAVAAYSAAVSFPSNAGSGSATAVTLSGMGKSNLLSSTITLVGSDSSVVPGEPITLTATVTGSGATPTGTVTFSAASDGASQGVLGTATLNSAGVATYYGLIWVGNDTVMATYNGDTTYSSSASNTVAVANFSVSGKLSFNWPYVAFGQPVTYGASSSAWPVTLQNLTGASVAAPSLSFSGGTLSNFKITGNTCTATIAQGAVCSFNVVFAPTSGGSANGSKVTETLTAGSGSSSATLSVSGTAISSALLFNWPFLNFTPTVSVGASSSAWPVTLTNSSSSSTTLASPAVSFTDGSFTLTGDNCSGATLAAGASCGFSVVFTPLAADVTASGTNILSGTMTASGNSGAITGSIAVSGWTGAALSFNWPYVNFQAVAQGSTGANPWPVTVLNNSGQALTGVSYTLTGGTNYASGAFTLSNTCSTIAAGASCTFNVVPTPSSSQSVGSYSATLTVSGTGGAVNYSSYALTLSGSVSQGGLSINWNQDLQNGVSTIDFGPQNTVGVPSGPWPITVYNNTPGTQTLTLTPSLSQFTVDSSTCTNVASGSSCQFNLYFTPTAVEEYQGTLAIQGAGYLCTINTWGGANK